MTNLFVVNFMRPFICIFHNKHNGIIVIKHHIFHRLFEVLLDDLSSFQILEQPFDFLIVVEITPKSNNGLRVIKAGSDQFDCLKVPFELGNVHNIQYQLLLCSAKLPSVKFGVLSFIKPAYFGEVFILVVDFSGGGQPGVLPLLHDIIVLVSIGLPFVGDFVIQIGLLFLKLSDELFGILEVGVFVDSYPSVFPRDHRGFVSFHVVVDTQESSDDICCSHY